MIKINNLSKSFRNQLILNNISLEINKGDVIALIGSSGAGKSTFLRSLNYLEQADSGTISIDDKIFDFANLDKKQILELRRQSAMVFQSFNLFARKTALENVMEALIIVQKIPFEEAKTIAEKELIKVGLQDKLNHYPKHLSGGQQQRVAIARALAIKPKLLLLDEPTSALDIELVGEVLNSIKTAASEGNTMLLVSHDINFVFEVCNKVCFLDKGQIIESGTSKEVLNSPKTLRVQEFLSGMKGQLLHYL